LSPSQPLTHRVKLSPGAAPPPAAAALSVDAPAPVAVAAAAAAVEGSDVAVAPVVDEVALTGVGAEAEVSEVPLLLLFKASNGYLRADAQPFLVDEDGDGVEDVEEEGEGDFGGAEDGDDEFASSSSFSASRAATLAASSPSFTDVDVPCPLAA